MVLTKKKTSPYWYLFIVINILPVIAYLAGILKGSHIAYFYWGECALVAILALAMYAKYLVVFFLLSGAIGIIVYLANPAFMEHLPVVLVFWSLYSLCWLIYVEIGKSPYGQNIRKLSPAGQLTVYMAFMGISIGLCFLVTYMVAGEMVSEEASLAFYKTFSCVAVIVPSISTGLLKVMDMIGQKHFIDFMLGTYHLPVEKNRIVLFLDMVGSSGMAEKLEPKQSMDLIAKFIYDCSYIFRIHGGDILNYTGDGLVVLWPRGQSNGALAAVHQLQNHFAQKQVRSRYWKKFGIVPDFRIGIHAGPVVLSQIGEEKLFIGLYGDTVNTAARLEQMNKETGTNILLSAPVIQGLNQSWKALLKPLGKKSVRGRDEKVSVFTLYKHI